MSEPCDVIRVTRGVMTTTVKHTDQAQCLFLHLICLIFSYMPWSARVLLNSSHNKTKSTICLLQFKPNLADKNEMVLRGNAQ